MNRFSTSMSDIGHRVRLPVGHRGTPGGTVDILVPWSPAQKVPMASPNCCYNRNLLPVAPTSPRGEVAALEMSLYHSPRSTTLEIVPPIFWGVLGLNVGLPGLCCRGVGQEESAGSQLTQLEPLISASFPLTPKPHLIPAL